MIVVDTNVLSLLFRRNETPAYATPLRHRFRWLIAQQRLVVPCLVAQELLSGVRHQAQFDRIHLLIQQLPLVQTTPEQHVSAARIANACLTRGIVTHVTDTLIAAVAQDMHGWVLSEDPDFSHIAQCCELRVLSVTQALAMTIE